MKIKKTVVSALTVLMAVSLVSCNTLTSNKPSKEEIVEPSVPNESQPTNPGLPDVNFKDAKLTLNILNKDTVLTFKEGEEISLEEYLPTVDGYIFEGWYYDSSFALKINKERITIDRDITIYAKMKAIKNDKNDNTEVNNEVSLTFIGKNGSVIKSYENLKKNSLINVSDYAPNMEIEGFEFKGWFVDADRIIPANEKIEITKDTILYAKYEEKKKEVRTITFSYNDIEMSISVEKGTKINIEEAIIDEYPELKKNVYMGLEGTFLGIYDRKNNTYLKDEIIVEDDIRGLKVCYSYQKELEPNIFEVNNAMDISKNTDNWSASNRSEYIYEGNLNKNEIRETISYESDAFSLDMNFKNYKTNDVINITAAASKDNFSVSSFIQSQYILMPTVAEVTFLGTTLKNIESYDIVAVLNAECYGASANTSSALNIRSLDYKSRCSAKFKEGNNYIELYLENAEVYKQNALNNDTSFILEGVIEGDLIAFTVHKKTSGSLNLISSNLIINKKQIGLNFKK